MNDTQFEIYTDSAGEYRWRYVTDGDVFAVSTEAYAEKRRCWESAYRFRLMLRCDLRASNSVTVNHYKDAAGKYRWRLNADGHVPARPVRGHDQYETPTYELYDAGDVSYHAPIVEATG